MESRGETDLDIRPIRSGDEVWAAIVRQAAWTVDSAAALEAKLKQRYPDAMVRASDLEGLATPIWHVYRRRWFQRR